MENTFGNTKDDGKLIRRDAPWVRKHFCYSSVGLSVYKLALGLSPQQTEVWKSMQADAYTCTETQIQTHTLTHAQTHKKRIGVRRSFPFSIEFMLLSC
jgi:hypothetical protein